MRNTKNAFTLVELIVVITILAILGTIAFISLQGYSADARNSKRTSDLGNIQSAMSLKQVEGVPLLSFVDNTTTDAAVSGASYAGGASLTGEYKAGIPSYTTLNVAAKDFKDPTEKSYRVGATTYKGGAFQIASIYEVDGTNQALIKGNFVQRTTSNTGAINSIDGNVITVSDSAANLFKAGDLVALTGGTGVNTSITKVSRDGVTLTLANNADAGNNVIALQADESAGLIADRTVATGAVVDAGTTYLPY